MFTFWRNNITTFSSYLKKYFVNVISELEIIINLLEIVIQKLAPHL